MMQRMSIGEAAKQSGVKVPTIRFYEQIGLLETADRSENNRRVYNGQSLKRLRFIRHARELGFPVDAIRQLLELVDHKDRSCAEVDAIAKAHLAEIVGRIERLEALRSEISRMLSECDQDRIGDCRIVEVLADHAHCLHEQH